MLRLFSCLFLLVSSLMIIPSLGDEVETIDIVVRAGNDGEIHWSNVSKGIADTLAIDLSIIEPMLPSGSINVGSKRAALTLLALNIATRDKMAFDIVDDPQQRKAIRIRTRRDLFGAKPDASFNQATISIDDDWAERCGNDRPMVVCIHGLNSSAERFDTMRAHLRGNGFATAAIQYDDAQPISDTASEVAVIVNSIQRKQRQPKLALIGHSMGGLVARAMLENPEIESKTVSHLITLGTPHGGSHWATMPGITELITAQQFQVDQWVELMMDEPTTQALRDLRPGSQFLFELNARERVEHVRYTAVAGTLSPLSESHQKKLRDTLSKIDAKTKTVRIIAPRIRPFVDGMDEWIHGKGDGAVSVGNALIPGVEDIVKIEVSHGQLALSRIVFDIVLDRITEKDIED